MNSDLSAQRNLGLNLVSFTIQGCPIFRTVVFMPNVSMAFPPTWRGFARAGLFCLLVVNITKFSIKTKRDEETFTPALAKPLLYAVLFVFNV